MRDPKDFYPTPPACLDKALDTLHWDLQGMLALEPACGAGALLKPLRDRGAEVEAYDLYPYPGVTEGGVDFLSMPEQRGYDLLVTNPPFSVAQEFIEHAITQAPNVMLLLRLSMLGSLKRLPMWQRHPPSAMVILAPRPQFASVCPNCKTQYPPDRAGDWCDNHTQNLWSQWSGCKKIRSGSDNSEYAWMIWSEWSTPAPLMWCKWK